MGIHLAAILAERARVDHGVAGSATEVAALASHLTGIDREKMEALVWGLDVQLDPAEISELAAAFSLHSELLGCFICGASREGLEFTLQAIAGSTLNVAECGYCMEVAEAVDVLNEYSEEEVWQLALDLLSHLSADESELPLIVNDETDTDIDRVIELLQVLPQDSRRRVLAFAYQEHAEVTSGRPLGAFGAHAQLRDCLTALAREALDSLALTPGGSLTASELATGLGLASSRSLGSLRRTIERSVAELAAAGQRIESPLVVNRRQAGATRLSLSPAALATWRALLRSEGRVAEQGPVRAQIGR